MIYTPLETEFLKAAKAKGARTMGGAGMCVHQAVDAFRLFTAHADLARMDARSRACKRDVFDDGLASGRPIGDRRLQSDAEDPEAMKTSIATVSLSGTLDEKLEAIAAARFDAVEIFENDLVTFNGTPADVRDACRELGLDIVTLQPFRDFEGMPARQRERAFARAERKFDVMQELGCDLLMICSNVSPDAWAASTAPPPTCASWASAPPSAACGSPSRRWPGAATSTTTATAWEAVRRADHPAVGLVLDSFHILARGTDLSAIRSIPGDRIFLVQLADAPLLQMDYLSWSRHFRNFPGQGDLPVLDFMKALQATGYDGAAVARDLQRPVPRRLGAQRGDRRPSLAALHARPARRRPRRACRRAPKARGVELHRVLRRRSGRAAARRRCWRASASAAPASTAPRR